MFATSVEGPHGILAHARPATLVIDATTSEPGTSRDLAAKLEAAGHAFLDAPVSGLPLAAATGTLALMVGGEAADLERARPYLEPVAGKIVHAGPSGAGNVAKIVNNLLSATQTVLAAEATRLASRAGVELATLLEVVNASSGRSWTTDVLFPKFVLTDGYNCGFSVRLMRKDVRLGMQMAADTETDLPLMQLAGEIWKDSEAYLPDEADLTRMAEAVVDGRTSRDRC